MGLKEAGLRASVRSVSTVVPAFFDVAITNTNSPINEGDVLVVDYSVDNTGDSFETQDIRLEIDSVQEDADLDVSLSGGASDTGTLEWDTTGQGADTYEATVLSEDDSDTVTVEIPDAFFDVAIQSTNSPVEEGETLNVDYLVDNTGGVEDTQDIRLEIDNTQEDVDTGVTLDSGTSTTGTLQWDTTNESADTYSATVLSDDDSDSVTVEIEGAAIPDSGLNHQYDATKLDFNDGDTVTIWADESGNANDLDDGPGATYRDDGINGQPSVRFDGTDDYLDGPDPSIDTPITIFAVVECLSNGSVVVGYRSDEFANYEFRDSEDKWRWATVDGQVFASGDISSSLHTVVVDGTDTFIREDGSQTGSGDGTLTDINHIRVGARADSVSRHFDGFIGEIIGYNRRLDSSEIDDVESHLADKWGISI